MILVFSAIAPKLGQTQSTCNDCIGPCEFGAPATIICGNYADSYGPYYVKVYLYFVVPTDTNAFEDPLPVRSSYIWNNWSSTFSPHRIYFVPGFGGCDPSENFEVISSNLPPTSSTVSTFRSTGYSHADGIDVYIFRDDTSGSGWAYCIPHNYFYLAGKDPAATTEVLSKTPTISHEMGHCLGLLHTNEDDCEDFNGSDCANKGDMVCDTPPDDGQYFQNGTCTPDSIPASDYLNIMSAFKPPSCLTHFTPGQGKRMRYYLKNKIGPLDGVLQNDIIITGTVNWNTPMSPDANIIIKPGGRLYIYAPVTMREGAHIYVEAGNVLQQIPGGHLLVYSTITAACDAMWEGIVVAGYNQAPQTALFQGKVSVRAIGRIEHARCGIRTQGRYPDGSWAPGSGGGMVSSVFGHFMNNTIDVYLLHNGVDTTWSFFSNAQFVTTDAYRGDFSAVPKHLQLENVRGVRLFAGSIRDDRTDTFSDPATRASGIFAFNSSVNNYGGTTFTNLYEGLHISQTLLTPGNNVNGATFTNCFTGIYARFGDFIDFTGNQFVQGFPANYAGIDTLEVKGIGLDGQVSSMTIRQNTFTNPVTLGVRPLGIELFNVGTVNHQITNNTFFGIYTGTRASGTNAFQSLDGLTFSGLSYLCNVYDLNGGHDNLVVNGSIRKEQGPRDDQNIRISAGNRYNEIQGFPSAASQFTNAGARIEYHHRIGTLEELKTDQYTPIKVVPIDSDQNIGCGQSECPPPCDTASLLASLKSQFFSDKQAWISKITAYPALTDSLQQLAEAQTINRLRYDMDIAARRILLHYAFAGEAGTMDSVIAWLSHSATYDADMALARHRFFEGEYAAADSLFLLVPARYALYGQLLADYTDTRAVLNLIRPALQLGASLHELPAATLDAVESGWGTECFAAGSLARNILFWNGRRLRPDCSAESQRLPDNTVESKNLKPANSKMTIFPNPARNTITISNIKTTGETIVQIVDSNFGRISLEQKLALGQETVTIDLSPLPVDGLYFILLIERGRVLNTAKLLRIH